MCVDVWFGITIRVVWTGVDEIANLYTYVILCVPAKPDINTQPLFYSLRDNEIYLDIGNEEKIDNAFEIVCQWMDQLLIPKMNELCAIE